MYKFIKPAPVILTVFTLVGILTHDMHLDKVTMVAALPAIAASTGALEKVISPSYHTHVERVSMPRYETTFRSSLPNMQPARDDDRRYIQNKKLMYMGGGDASSLWPSI
ncbi:MAG: hypothetical protein ACOH18_04215 [Candidatus Saccharimonadaceae bacterium]